ncbi:MAG: hypothetical protein A3H44_14555 [Gammaproteobacteria bacterium RIFCSPLOWO2_02_FULL_57_10]|nr:MAG: hypothetical protein A3H44_14555 [Gammaproteobacteria bacterium RIFCSPLOWO2_02_FULL_57_10]
MNDRQYVINLSRQMADCDANYIRLLKLMPELESFRIKCLESLASTASYGNQEGAVPNFRSRDFYTVGAAGSEADCTREFVIASPVGGGEEVRVRISAIEVFRYTSTLEIVQLTRVSRWIDPPGILVRLYHDAVTAEAVAYQGHRSFLAKYATPNSKMYHQDEKRQINEFLGEWLSLCIQAGRSLKVPTFICAA